MEKIKANNEGAMQAAQITQQGQLAQLQMELQAKLQMKENGSIYGIRKEKNGSRRAKDEYPRI
jgi:hypothetical protein